jgi:Ca-activated chloride channel family protein
VAEHLAAGALNRVLVLSDGLANRGVTDPNAITRAVKDWAGRGVSTTTMGLGDDYNEDLMEAMGESGEGNYYFISAPVMLADIFASELSGLMATFGQKASLGLECGEGVAVADVLNDFERLPTGRLRLPNLVAGMPLQVVVRLNVPARADGAPGLVVSTRLAWDPPGGGARRSLHARLDLPAVPVASWALLPEDPAVVEQEALLMAARAQKEAAQAMLRGDYGGTRDAIAMTRQAYHAMPPSPAVMADLADLDAMEAQFEAGNIAGSAKLGKFTSWKRRRGQGEG